MKETVQQDGMFVISGFIVWLCTKTAICTLISQFQRALRRNPPEFRVTSGQKPSTKIIYIASQKKSFLATPNVENECWTSY